MSNRNFLPGLRPSLVSLALASSLAGVMVACSSDTPTATQVPSTISAQLPETGAPATDGIAFYYDGVKTSVTIKDAAVLFAACTLNTGDSTKIVNFVNNTLKIQPPITAAEVTGLGDPLKLDISDFTGDSVVNCNDAAVLFAVVTVGADAAKVNQFVSNTLKVPGVKVTQDQLDRFFPKSTPTPTPSPTATPTVTPSPTATPTPTGTPTPTPTPTPVAGLTLTPADFLGSNAINVFGGGVKSKTFTAVPVKPVEGGNLVINLSYRGTALVNVTPLQISFAPGGTPVPATITVTTQAGVNPVGTGEITFTVAGASTAKGFTPGEVLGSFALEVIDKAPPTPTPTGTPTPTTPGIIIEPPNLEVEEGGRATFTIKPAVAPVGGTLIVNVGPFRTGGTLGNISASALPTIVSPPPTQGVVTLTFPAGSTTPRTITIQGGNQNGNVVGAVGTATLEIQVAGGSTATNYPPTLDIPDPTITVTPTDFNVFFVDPVNGDDSNNGRASTPFKTLAGVFTNNKNPGILVQSRANLGNAVTVKVINPPTLVTETLANAIASGSGGSNAIGGAGDLANGSITIIGPGTDSSSKYTLNLGANNLGLDKGVTLKNLVITSSGGSIQLAGGNADGLNVSMSSANNRIFVDAGNGLGGVITNSTLTSAGSSSAIDGLFVKVNTLKDGNTLEIRGNKFTASGPIAQAGASNGAGVEVVFNGKGTLIFSENRFEVEYSTSSSPAGGEGAIYIEAPDPSTDTTKQTVTFSNNNITVRGMGGTAGAAAIRFKRFDGPNQGDSVLISDNVINIRGVTGGVIALKVDTSASGDNAGPFAQILNNIFTSDGNNQGTGIDDSGAVSGGAVAIGASNNTFSPPGSPGTFATNVDNP